MDEKRDFYGVQRVSAVYARAPRTRLVKTALLVSSLALLSTLYPISISWTPAGLFSTPVSSQSADLADPAHEWRDDVWPLREQTPWDISTDFPFPRKLKYDVTEGTWMRLDVHPKTGEVIFDLLGDIYCLPASAYDASSLSAGAHTRAVPVLKGVPHDSDPHFSPDGTQFVFRSDAGLGVENIWVKRWNGCAAADIRPAHATGDIEDALNAQEVEEELLASGVQETPERKYNRLLREGRYDAKRVTNETYRWVSDARFHPDSTKIVATKWFTSGRSLGAGEAWEFSIPRHASANSIRAGSGELLVGRTLPLGWGAEDYGDQQVGPEQFIWKDNDTLIYSKNVRDTNGGWEYSKDVYKGINAIFSTNITSKQTTTLVDANPGGATRPELSRDGRTLAFVRRDLETGTLRNVWYGLTYDLSIVSAPMGTYPSFAFTPKDDAIIIWAAGKIYHVPLGVNKNGERVSAGEPQVIPFQAHVEKRIAETRSSKTDLKSVETAETQRVYAFHELRVDEAGDYAVFQAAGATYVQKVEGSGKHRAEPVPVRDRKAPYYSPSFVPGAPHLVLHARWSDVEFTTLELANLTSGTAHILTGLPFGRYYSPILCACSGSKRQIAFLRTGGDYLTGDVVATAGAGLYIGELTLPSGFHDRVAIKNLKFVPSEIDTDDVLTTQLRFLDKNKKLLVSSLRRAFVIDLAGGPDKDGAYKHETLAKGRMSAELAVPPPSKSKKSAVAIVDFHHVYYAPAVAADDAVWSKPANATKGLQRLSVDGGHSITWSADGSKLFWFLGPYLHYVDVSTLSVCAKAAQKDKVNFGIECTKSHPKYQEVVVEYASDIARLKEEAAAFAEAEYGKSAVEDANSGADFFVFANATLLTMSTGNIHNDILHDAVLVTRNGQIEAIAGVHDYVIPYGATVLDAEGGYVVPGFIDVHAHWNGFETAFPARSWEMATFLAYGVTTLHNPSADTVLAFAERFRLERGQLVGPRIFQTGTIVYGAGAPVYHEDIVSMEEARSALLRIKVEGGPSSFSYKNYNLPSRASRQRLLLAARELGMLCFPEGGMNYDWDQTYIVDGMTTVEHALPIPVLYDDVLSLYALSGTGSTPTHIVNYGGVMGEQLIWATEDIPNNEKLRRFARHDGLESLTESTARPKLSYQAFNTSISTAKLVRKGLKAHIGAHGEPPLGVNYHAEMWYTQSGGLTNYETLRAATSDAAATLGIDDAVGSLTPGKLADFVVYPPGVDLLEGHISGTRDIRFVVKGGRVFEASTLAEVWPVPGRKEPLPPINAD
uniref:Cytochrome P450 monooxygenase AKT7 ) n=1 Tax=Ganoderma boninense TaxID=34458 RepID=A0A5K1K012_9APHY|nr:Cytochrome P450 monooxygenase AKT7 (EC (AK-toxin biosynthesis protein 7) [Ganoderma boninense]